MIPRCLAAAVALATLASAPSAPAEEAGAGPVEPPSLDGAPPERARWLGFADAGVVAVTGSLSPNLAFGARAGVEGPWLLAEVTFDQFQTRLVDQAFVVRLDHDDGLFVTALGLDLGAVHRGIWRKASWEVRGGAGLQRFTSTVAGTTDPFGGGRGFRDTTTRLAQTLFAAASIAGPSERWRLRWRVGAEVRAYLGATADVPATGKSITVAELSAGLFLGLELGVLRGEPVTSRPPP